LNRRDTSHFADAGLESSTLSFETVLTLHLDHNQRLVAGTGDALEGPELDVGLHDGVLELAADQTLGIEDLSP